MLGGDVLRAVVPETRYAPRQLQRNVENAVDLRISTALRLLCQGLGVDPSRRSPEECHSS